MICPDQLGSKISCVEAANAVLRELVDSGPVACVKERRLGHGFFLGHCRTADGTDPAETLLARGLLLPQPENLPERYARAAATAKAADAGLWGG